ncbi:MAG: tetratricopeptide repeat protein, partial [Deltaproteobacteria bacterium]
MKETIERIFCLVLIIVLGFLAWKKLPIFFSNKGYESYQKAQYKQAADLFERALKLDPGDLKSMSWLGSTYEKMGRADKAEEQYVKVLSIDRRRPEEHLSYIRLLLERKAYDQAIAAADAAVSANPGDQNLSDARREAASQYNAVLINRAVDTFSLGRHEEAYRLLRRSQELEENYPMRDYVLGVFYMKDSRYQDACASLEKVLAKVPSFAPASKLLGSLYMDRGMFREAEEAYKKALDSDASDPLVYNDLGILYMKQERYAEALPMVQKAVELMPGDTDTLYNLASVCRDNRAFDKAEAEYRRLLTLDPGYPNVHND